VSFDQVGLPGFQFVQDNLDYFTNVHHSDLDVLDHIVAEDLKHGVVDRGVVCVQRGDAAGEAAAEAAWWRSKAALVSQ
jgi:hypothetical protein